MKLVEDTFIDALALEVGSDVTNDVLDDMEVNAGEIDSHVTVFGLGFEERQRERKEGRCAGKILRSGSYGNSDAEAEKQRMKKRRRRRRDEEEDGMVCASSRQKCINTFALFS